MIHFRQRKVQLGLGLAFWVTIAAALYASVSAPDATEESPRRSLSQFLVGNVERFESTDTTGRLRKRDPIFWQSPSGQWRQVGYVDSSSEGVNEQVEIVWYDPRVEVDRCRLVYHRNSGKLEEVVATLMPAEKREQIKQRLAEAMARDGQELSAAFVPLVERTVRESLPIIEDEFRLATDRHRADIDRLARRWNEEIVSERLIPMARREILPIVREHGQPVAEDIGRELWDRASLWRFGWRAVYDKIPLPERNLVQQEWDRFVQQEAIPVFQSRMDQIVIAVQQTVGDVAANPRVRRELADVADQFAADPETRQLVRTILAETFVENPRLHEVWSEVWESEQAVAALELAGDRLEPVVRGIGDDLFGSQESGINPDFARVLRNQILRKDQQWIVARTSDDPDLSTIAPASDWGPYPLVYVANPLSGAEGSGGDRQ